MGEFERIQVSSWTERMCLPFGLSCEGVLWLVDHTTLGVQFMSWHMALQPGVQGPQPRTPREMLPASFLGGHEGGEEHRRYVRSEPCSAGLIIQWQWESQDSKAQSRALETTCMILPIEAEPGSDCKSSCRFLPASSL